MSFAWGYDILTSCQPQMNTIKYGRSLKCAWRVMGICWCSLAQMADLFWASAYSAGRVGMTYLWKPLCQHVGSLVLPSQKLSFWRPFQLQNSMGHMHHTRQKFYSPFSPYLYRHIFWYFTRGYSPPSSPNRSEYCQIINLSFKFPSDLKWDP